MTLVETAFQGKPSGSMFERSLIEASRARCSAGLSVQDVNRIEALAWLERHGLGTARSEAWRSSSLTALASQELRSPNSQQARVAQVPSLPPIGDSSVLSVVDGIPESNADRLIGVRWMKLGEVLRGALGAQLGRLVRPENGFVAANLAGYVDGWCLVVEPGAVIEIPIELRIVDSTDVAGRLSLPRLLVVAGASSRLRLVERHYSPDGETTVSSQVSEIVLDAGAKVEHSRFVEHGNRTWAIATTAVQVAEHAEYRSWSVTSQGRYVRHDLAVRLAGRGATTILDGLYFARAGETVAQHTRIWHDQPEGRTAETYRGVIENRGRGIFDGCITVGRGAMRTDARQENRNLLLGPEAIADTKPQLEIDADDVSCSHGATTGQLDDQQLFYLRARGIDENEARQVLTWAFAQEIVQRCPDDALGHEVERQLRTRAAQGAALEVAK